MISRLVTDNQLLLISLNDILIVLFHCLEAKVLLELSPGSLSLSHPRVDPFGVLVPFDNRRFDVDHHVSELLILKILSVLHQDIGVVVSIVACCSLLDRTLDLIAGRGQ